MGAFIAHLVGSPGGRTTVLMAYVDELNPVPSAAGQARAEGMRNRVKGFLRPVAIRACGGKRLIVSRSWTGDDLTSDSRRDTLNNWLGCSTLQQKRLSPVS